ncbi:hypothetical protein [Caudoviricetes sp.]|nr:hypothetical protein [Caudoviricetes sp.]
MPYGKTESSPDYLHLTSGSLGGHTVLRTPSSCNEYGELVTPAPN